jgi:predicted Zn-dependent protease
VYRPTYEEVQRERERLAARSQEYYRQQKERVERIGKQLLAQIPNPPNIEFLIVEGDQRVNAGATFGQIVVTAGMLHFARTDDELATVLGHELGHHTQGHITKAVATGIATAVAATAAAIAVESVAPGTGRIAGGLVQGLANHFNQGQELEADEVGLRYAAAAGYNPEAAVELFERMAVEVPQTLTAEFFASHPSSPERILAARKIAESLIASGVYAAKPEEPAPASAPTAEPDMADEESDESVPASPSRTIRQEFHEEAASPLDAKLRTLYHELRAGRISEEDYEVRKRALLSGSE